MNAMLGRLRTLLERPPPPTADTVSAPYRRRDIAVAALLIEFAQIDGGISPDELAAVDRMLREWLGLDGQTAAGVLKAAQSELDAALEDWIFANAVRSGFGEDERVEIVGLLWEIVYTDGRLARLEEAPLQRLAAELGVDAQSVAQARAQAYAKVGSHAGADASGPETE